MIMVIGAVIYATSRGVGALCLTSVQVFTQVIHMGRCRAIRAKRVGDISLEDRLVSLKLYKGVEVAGVFLDFPSVQY